MEFDFYDENDIRLDSMLEQMKLTDGIDFDRIGQSDAVETFEVCRPTETFNFLHEAAVISFKGVLYASWYNCGVTELKGYTPIRGAKSSMAGGRGLSPRSSSTTRPEKSCFAHRFMGSTADKLYVIYTSNVDEARQGCVISAIDTERI